MAQLILHLLGDYILQSHWMAVNKSKRGWPCFLHCLTYTLPFLILTRSPLALTVIFVTHFAIDRCGLARYLVWLKNWQVPGGYFAWRQCSLTGYFDPELESPEQQKVVKDAQGNVTLESSAAPEEVRPIWLRVWLLIVADNTLHLICNWLALAYC